MAKSTLVIDYGIFMSAHFNSLPNRPQGLLAQLTEISRILQTYEDAQSALEGDDGLSEKGRGERLRAAYDVASKALNDWQAGKLEGIEKQLTVKRTALVAESDKLQPAPSGMQVQNMVQRLSGFDPAEIDVLYYDATDGERRVIEAAATSIGRQPVRRGDKLVWEPILSTERVDEARTSRAERLLPEQAEAVHGLEHVRDTYQAAGAAAKTLLSATVPSHLLPEPEPEVVSA